MIDTSKKAALLVIRQRELKALRIPATVGVAYIERALADAARSLIMYQRSCAECVIGVASPGTRAARVNESGRQVYQRRAVRAMRKALALHWTSADVYTCADWMRAA